MRLKSHLISIKIMSTRSTSPALGALLIGALQRGGQRIALTTATEQITYTELDERSSRFAAGLMEYGISTGQPVALLLRNSIEYAVADLAIIKLGAVKVPLNELLSASDVAYCISHSGATTLIAHASLAHLLTDLTDIQVIVVADDNTEIPGAINAQRLLDYDPLSEARPAHADQTALIMYTGGTTGRPKGIVHNAGALGTNLYAHIVNGEIGSDARLMLTTPLPHSAGFFLQAALLAGATTRLESGFDPVRFLDLVAAERITWTFMVPTMIYRLLDVLETRPSDTSSLETIFYGAAPMSTARIEQALTSLGPVFMQLFGQSECPNFATKLSREDHRSPNLLASCGQPCPGVEVRIGDEDGKAMPTGKVGEVLLRAPYTLRKYHNAPDLTAAAFSGEWLCTGDVGYQNETRHLFLVDRKKDMIITGGMNVYSSEVEQVLFTHPKISAAAVIGVPDDDWGEAVHAFLVADEAIDFTELKHWCREKLGGYKTPKRFTTIDALPTTAYGKIDKKALRQRWVQRD